MDVSGLLASNRHRFLRARCSIVRNLKPLHTTDQALRILFNIRQGLK
jgi:hypothetical protein